jgi:hypothetical protein
MTVKQEGADMATNGTTGSPLEEEVKRRENEWMHGQEREEDAGEKGPSFPCPPQLWTGHYGAIADIIGVRDWRVWLGITAALSARAHRNLHANYYGDLYGMGYWLLVSGSSTGKSLMTRTCAALLPYDYRKKYSVESGQGLLNLIAASQKGEDGKTTKQLTPIPTLLMLSEWSTLLSNMEIRGSSLLEKLCECYDAEHAIEVNRTEKQGHSDSYSVESPMLTMLGATTIKSFRKRVRDYHKESGFLNRHFILPGPYLDWKYLAKEEQEYFPRSELEAYAQVSLPTSQPFGLGRAMRSLYDPVALVLDGEWGSRLFEPLHNERESEEDLSPYLRLHVYARRIAALIAWSEGADFIQRHHVEATHAAVECSYSFLRWLLTDAPIEMPPWQRVQGEIEEKIIRKIKEKPGIVQRDLCNLLRKNGGYPAISERIDKLLKSGAVSMRREGQKKCLYLPS